MQIKVARSFSPSAREDLRKRVVQAVRDGMSQVQAAKVIGVARGTVDKLSRFHEESGIPSL